LYVSRQRAVFVGCGVIGREVAHSALVSGIVAVYAYRGESDEAFWWLDRAYGEKDPILIHIKYSVEFDLRHAVFCASRRKMRETLATQLAL
jgi:hypothetical protein